MASDEADGGTVTDGTTIKAVDVEAELAACRRLLGICQAFLPNGWLHDTVRLVAEGGSAEAAWEAIEEMTRWECC